MTVHLVLRLSSRGCVKCALQLPHQLQLVGIRKSVGILLARTFIDRQNSSGTSNHQSCETASGLEP